MTNQEKEQKTFDELMEQMRPFIPLSDEKINDLKSKVGQNLTKIQKGIIGVLLSWISITAAAAIDSAADDVYMMFVYTCFSMLGLGIVCALGSFFYFRKKVQQTKYEQMIYVQAALNKIQKENLAERMKNQEQREEYAKNIWENTSSILASVTDQLNKAFQSIQENLLVNPILTDEQKKEISTVPRPTGLDDMKEENMQDIQNVLFPSLEPIKRPPTATKQTRKSVQRSIFEQVDET